MVAYALDEGRTLILFLSQLAQHTRNMLDAPQVSLAISEPDTGEEDPQRLQRVTLTGSVEVIRRGTDAFHAAGQSYVDRFPDALSRFELGDFVLFRFTPTDARYVGGFARASRFTWDDVANALREI
jgi:putative heme iron utilization protein